MEGALAPRIHCGREASCLDTGSRFQSSLLSALAHPLPTLANTQMQFIFNSRKEADADDNKKLLTMVKPANVSNFVKDLNTTHFW